ncbi:MAG: Hpt domain-containing protein [Marinilabiliaceae bacterium]|jgi:HPt (histidine-containing phosphotransfer) domain-containing protein|nr:Hpt domain-containing protein [Marinilabiliaceae bacterium]
MKIINVAYIEEVCGGSREIIIEMIDIFRQQVPEFCNEMTDLLEHKKYYDLGLLAHKAKSSVAIMGMENMARKLKELEIKAKAGEDTESYPQYIDDFNEACKIALKDLDEYIKSL